MSEATAKEFYFDRVVTALVMFSVIWAVVAMSVGVYIAAELLWPTIDFGQQWLSFGRLRPLHTNGIIFGFGVSALMGTAFYSVQRTSHVPLFAPKLAWFTAIAWQFAVLTGGLNQLLRELQLRCGSSSFGVCEECHLFGAEDAADDMSGPHRCGLTGEPICEIESQQICVSFRLDA